MTGINDWEWEWEEGQIFNNDIPKSGSSFVGIGVGPDERIGVLPDEETGVLPDEETGFIENCIINAG
jgi:hypothetical protein